MSTRENSLEQSISSNFSLYYYYYCHCRYLESHAVLQNWEHLTELCSLFYYGIILFSLAHTHDPFLPVPVRTVTMESHYVDHFWLLPTCRWSSSVDDLLKQQTVSGLCWHYLATTVDMLCSCQWLTPVDHTQGPALCTAQRVIGHDGVIQSIVIGWYLFSNTLFWNLISLIYLKRSSCQSLVLYWAANTTKLQCSSDIL